MYYAFTWETKIFVTSFYAYILVRIKKCFKIKIFIIFKSVYWTSDLVFIDQKINECFLQIFLLQPFQMFQIKTRNLPTDKFLKIIFIEACRNPHNLIFFENPVWVSTTQNWCWFRIRWQICEKCLIKIYQQKNEGIIVS